MKKTDAKIAVVGATGNVGRAMLSILAERGFPANNIIALASDQSAGRQISYGDDHVLTVQSLKTFSFKGIDISLFSPGAKISAEYAPKAAEEDCIVIDNTSYFRMDPQIPLVVPEVNPQMIADYKNKGIIANPNCSTIQLVVALKPLHDIAPIKRVVAATYQSVSGAGKEGIDELFQQSKSVFVNDPLPPRKFTRPIAFNVIPHIDVFMDDGSTKEEWKMTEETKKILDPSILVTTTCVRVPVFIGHSVAANIEFNAPLSPEKAKSVLSKISGIIVSDKTEEEDYITPAQIAGDDPVYISRIRKDNTVEHGLNMWIVADNVRKGAALNAIQIAEILLKEYL